MVALSDLAPQTTENSRLRYISFQKQRQPLNNNFMKRQNTKEEPLEFILIYFIDLGKDHLHWQFFNSIIHYLNKNLSKKKIHFKPVLCLIYRLLCNLIQCWQHDSAWLIDWLVKYVMFELHCHNMVKRNLIFPLPSPEAHAP